jgi:hypothetical protein
MTMKKKPTKKPTKKSPPKPRKKKLPERKKTWDTNHWENSSADGIV